MHIAGGIKLPSSGEEQIVHATTGIEDTGRAVDYTYDALYRLVTEHITDAALVNETISYTYDPVGNILTNVDDKGNTTTFVYDALDRLVLETFADATYMMFSYDANSNLKERTDNNGAITFIHPC